MDIHYTSDIPDDDPMGQAIQRARAQVNTLQDSLNYNFLTVQLIVDDEDRMNAVVVAHNPCDLKQYQVVAFLPTMDNSLEMLKANEAAGQEVAKIEDDMPDELAETVMDLCIKRFARAASHDPEALLRISSANSFEEARHAYQKHYGLTEGGDFNHPLE